MQKGFLSTALIGEERRATKLFLYLFYTISIGYDFVYNILLPLLTSDNARLGIVKNYDGYWMNAVQLLLLPFVLQMIKRNRPQSVKYLVFYVYTAMSITTEIAYYYGNTEVYHGGNIIEIFLVMFSPIFVSKRYYWIVSCGTILKYVIVGFVIQYPLVIVPILLILVFSFTAYVLLNVFQGYVNTLAHSLNEQFERIVKGIVAVLELKDPYTRGHSERVAQYSLSLARKIGLFTEEELNAFYYSCLLHDIGKVNIPDHILTKPSALTEEEYEIIKTHPTVGVEAIKGIEGLDWTVDVIKHHHERWDGLGYPDKLKERSIPLLARIASIADAFDAMTTHRSYRAALTTEEAYRLIVEGSGKQYDPFLVQAFQDIYPSWVALISQLNDHDRNSGVSSISLIHTT